MGWVEATVTAHHRWNEALFTLELDRAPTFVAGQFFSLTLDPAGGRRTRRAYSVASAPGEKLAFLLVEIPDGPVSPGLRRLVPGQRVFVAERPKGRFTLDRVPAGVSTLWMFATGTGIAPYRSMARAGALRGCCERAIIVYGVRTAEHAIYAEELPTLQARNGIPIELVTLVSRAEPGPDMLRGRIPEQVDQGALEARIGRPLDEPDSHVMLCGNPAMIRDMLDRLQARGLHRHTPRVPGQVTTEPYW